ncbi:unnamed protein product [Thelazia callipaeda]|uniref:Cytochrome b5 heme-binding domain-containing protein n=1 Tax=Thelazia callipaeda TaxID=103827 RepID=A0A0N5D163_THECL|nr:unnamed protein product [Thelazia callipaeda]
MSVLEFSWLDVAVLFFTIYIIYHFFLKKTTQKECEQKEKTKSLPPMHKKDFTVQELLSFNGVDSERILIALCGKVFDVTSSYFFYGPEGAYSKLAGHDATRALCTMNMELVKDIPDDISDIPDLDLHVAKEWYQSFICKLSADHIKESELASLYFAK